MSYEVNVYLPNGIVLKSIGVRSEPFVNQGRLMYKDNTDEECYFYIDRIHGYTVRDEKWQEVVGKSPFPKANTKGNLDAEKAERPAWGFIPKLLLVAIAASLIAAFIVAFLAIKSQAGYFKNPQDYGRHEGYVGGLSRYHDDELRVTCWAHGNGGISCLPDKAIGRK